MFHSAWKASNSSLYNKNFTTNKKSDDNFLNNTEIIGILLCHSFLGIIGLVNIGVILVITFNRIMLDIPANWLVVSLAIADAACHIYCNKYYR